MPRYRYHARRDNGETVEGVVDADNQDEAVEKISASNCFPTKIEEVDVSPSGSTGRGRSGRISSKDITNFSRQLASLLRAGVPLLHGLDVISEQSTRAGLKGMLEGITTSIKEGASFSAALGQYPEVFPSLYVAIVRAGETSGTMEESLTRIADYRRKQEQLVARVRTALVYPVLMAAVGVGVTVFMLVYVLPRLAGIFEGLDQELPLPTRIVLGVSSTLQMYWPWILAALCAAALAMGTGGRTELRRLVFDRLKLKLPLLGGFFLKVELARFSRTMEILIRSGIPILAAIRTASSVLDNGLIREELKRTGESLEQGGSFGRSLKSSPLFTPFMTSMIIVGEESGRLDESLAEVADSYERDTDDAVATSTALLEPLMILIVGSVVGFIVVAMLLPIFELDMAAGM